MDSEVRQIKEMAEKGLCHVFKKTYFVQTENSFIRNRKYTMAQKMVYQALQSYAGALTSCFPSKGTLAKDLKTSVKTIERTLRQLEDMEGILIVNQITQTNRKTSNIYILCEIDKDTGDFIPGGLDIYKCLKGEPLKVSGK